MKYRAHYIYSTADPLSDTFATPLEKVFYAENDDAAVKYAMATFPGLFDVSRDDGSKLNLSLLSKQLFPDTPDHLLKVKPMIIELAVKWAAERQTHLLAALEDKSGEMRAAGSITVFGEFYPDITLKKGDRVVIQINPPPDQPAEQLNRWLIPMWVIIAITLAGGFVGYILKGLK